MKNLLKKQPPSPPVHYERGQNDSSTRGSCSYESPSEVYVDPQATPNRGRYLTDGDTNLERNDDLVYMETPREPDAPVVPPRRGQLENIDRRSGNELYYNVTSQQGIGLSRQPVAHERRESHESLAQLHPFPEPEQGVSDYQNRGGKSFSDSGKDKFGAEMHVIYDQMQRRCSDKLIKDDNQEKEDSIYASTHTTYKYIDTVTYHSRTELRPHIHRT